MNGSYQIGSAFGIPIRLHWSFLLLFAIALMSGQPAVLLILFGSVLLHELGHSVAAQRHGVRVVDITLWPLGGMARLSGMPENPRVETIVALAGPAVNGAIVAICAPLLFASVFVSPTAAALLQRAIEVNVVLGLFNLLPAFPMDGGRVLRAFFARKLDWVSATDRAARIGRTVAYGMIALPVVGFLLPGSWGSTFCMMPVIGLFVLFAGLQELMAIRVRHGMPPLDGAAFFGRAARGGAAPGAGFGRDPFDLGGLGGVGGDTARRAEGDWSSEADVDVVVEEPDVDYGRARRPRDWNDAPDGRQGFDE